LLYYILFFHRSELQRSNLDRFQRDQSMKKHQIDLRSRKRLVAEILSANKNDDLLLITKQIFNKYDSHLFRCQNFDFQYDMIKKTQLYKIIDGTKYWSMQIEFIQSSIFSVMSG